jgi:hypothetical protein
MMKKKNIYIYIYIISNFKKEFIFWNEKIIIIHFVNVETDPRL